MKAADASSPVERKRVQDYYDQTLLSRLDDKQNGRIINIQQRLHEDDITGYLLDKANFEHLNLTAIAEEEERIALGDDRYHVRSKGEALFPEKEPLETLENLRTEMGAFAFSSQYQQNPIPLEGNRLRWEWFGEYNERPDRTALQMVVQSWDTASTGDPSSDFSACTVWGYQEGNWLLLEVVRERLEYPDLKRRAIGLAKNWLADKVLIEYAATGIPLSGELIELGEFPVLRIKPRLDKEIRFSAQGAKLETGTYLLPKAAPWLAAFKHELLGFPNAKYDDQVDSVSQFLTWTGSRRGAGWQHMKLTGKRRRRPSRRSRDSMRA
jgi:predicted phage terminase large subunit-like protein